MINIDDFDWRTNEAELPPPLSRMLLLWAEVLRMRYDPVKTAEWIFASRPAVGAEFAGKEDAFLMGFLMGSTLCRDVDTIPENLEDLNV